MVKNCRHPDCKTTANYNVDGKKEGVFCAKHKKEGMIDVKHKTCLHFGCKTRAYYNVDGKKEGVFCAKHKQKGMINVNNKTCRHPDCKTQPNYNVDGKKQGLFCVKHKKEGMIDVRHKTCHHPDCKTRAHYNVDGKKEGLFCAKHKKEGMIDVKHKTCLHFGCKTRAHYNVDGKKEGLFCVKHKKKGMINVKTKTCRHPDCKTQPIYNVDGKKEGLFCAKHKKEGMIDVKNKTCLTYLCFITVSEKYEGYCLSCFMKLFPDKPVARNYKTKEFAVVDYVKTHFPDFPWIANKRIIDGCSARLPDLYIDLGYQILIIEIDEDQHGGYDCTCENKRLMLISQDFGHRPIVLIRFNPDKYLKKDVRVKSCWKINGKGICVINDLAAWQSRLLVLKNQLDYWLNPINQTEKMVEVIELFYDE